MRKRWLALAAAAAASLSVAGWARFLSRDAQLTRGRRMPVVDARGERLDIRRANDIKLQLVRDGGKLWTVGQSGGKTHLVRFDLGARRGEALWEIEDHRWSLGWSPGPKEQIGYVYKRDDERVAAGVVGPDGWLVEPFVLPLPDGLNTLEAMAWSGSRLEIAMRTSRHARKVISLGVDGTVRRRELDGVCAKVWQHDGQAVEEPSCSLIFLGHRGGEWWLDARIGAGKERRRYRVSESGSVHEPLGERLYGVDRVALGVLGDAFHEQVLSADGRIVPAPAPPPGLEDNLLREEVYEVSAGELSRRRRWFVDSQFVYETKFGLLKVDHGRQRRGLVETSSGGRRAVVLLDYHQLFLESVPFESEGGLLLVDASGRYIELDAEGRRRDPLAWNVHLESFHGRRRALRPFSLLWVLLGLPIALLPAGAALARRARRRRATKLRAEVREERWPPARIAAWGCLLYVASAAMALKVLWPMME